MDKNEELQKWLNDDRYVRAKDLKALWNVNQNTVYLFLSKHKIRPVKKFNIGNGGYAFYDKQQCIDARSMLVAKEQEVKQLLADNRFVTIKDLAMLWGVSNNTASVFIHAKKMQPIKRILGGCRGIFSFYDRAECERARPFINQPEQKEVEKVENIGELATATKHQILRECGADDFVWDKVTMKNKIMPVKNYCDERGNFISLFKKDETVSAILAYKNEQKQLLEKCLADKTLVTTTQLAEMWNTNKKGIYNKIYKLKIKPHVKVKLENGNIWHFYKKSDCIESQEVEKVKEKQNIKNTQSDGIFCGDIALGKFAIVSNASDARIVSRLAGDIVCPVLSVETPDKNYEYIKKIIGKDVCLVMIEDNDPDHKSVMYWLDLPGASPWLIPTKYGKNITEALDNGVIIREFITAGLEDLCKGFYTGSSRQIAVMPEPKEQTPDIIPADTIDLFTMSELESELKNRGVELTAEVRAKIDASDMPEMQHIATMLRGNAKTIAIRLSVLNEIAGQLKIAKKLSFYEKVRSMFPIKEPPTSVKSEPKNEGAIDIAALSKEQALDFIRNRLRFKERIYLRGVTGNHDMTKEHRRFDMSGYDRTTRGDCTLHNMAILNEFADLGIYDYTDYLFLDFYKGQPTLYMRYFKDDKHLDFELCGWTTSEIIYFIFQKTILSGKNKRRRD